MIYDAAALAQLSQSCAPTIAAQALLPLIDVESGGNPLSININHGPRVRARSVPEGAALVRRYVGQGYSVDVGLAQINSRNFARLGLSVEAALNPCTNLQAAAKVLEEGYAKASLAYQGIQAISATYSFYNTGTLDLGFRTGYVSSIWTAANALLTRGQLARQQLSVGASAAAINAAKAPAAKAEPVSQPAAKNPSENWVIGETLGNAVVVFR